MADERITPCLWPIGTDPSFVGRSPDPSNLVMVCEGINQLRVGPRITKKQARKLARESKESLVASLRESGYSVVVGNYDEDLTTVSSFLDAIEVIV